MVNHHRPRDVHVPEADGMSAFETYKEVDGGVGAGGGELPDGVGETGVIDLLSFAVG